MKFIGRISGIVTYVDNTHDQFAANRDERGNVSINAGINSDYNSSNQAILEVQTDENWLEGMLALVSDTLALAPSGTATKVVNSAVMHFSGRVSRDNGTWEDFAVQYDIKADGAFVLNSSGLGGTVAAYTEFTSAILTDWLGSMIGAGNVTV